MERTMSKKSRGKKKGKSQKVRRGGPRVIVPFAGGFGMERVTCLASLDWQTAPRFLIHVFHTWPDSDENVVVTMVIDRQCLGIEAAFGDYGVTLQEFNTEILPDIESQNFIVAITLADARRIAFGALQYGKRNGFKPPENWQMITAALGANPKFNDADLHGFALEKIYFTGSKAKLSKRLLDCTIEEFLARPNVVFTEAEDPEARLEKLVQTMDELSQRGVEAVEQWCRERGMERDSHLAEAWKIMLIAVAQCKYSADDGLEEQSDNDLDFATRACGRLDNIVVTLAGERQAELQPAFDQISQYSVQLGQPDPFAAVGFDPASEE
jgi:hypothetical protein